MYGFLKLYATMVVLLCLFTNNIISQNTLYFIPNSWQSSLINPAFTDTSKLIFSLPNVAFKLYSPDFKIKQLLQPDSSGVLSLNEIAKNRIENRNRIMASVNIQTFGISVKINPKLTLNASHSVKGASFIDIDGKILKVAFNGLDNYVGNTYDFYASINGSIYSSLGIGASYKLNKNVQIGGRMKYLNGISSFFTQNGDARIKFENYNYGMSFDNNINVSSYSLNKLKEFKTLRGVIQNTFLGRNKGIAFDFGASFQLEKLQLSVSIIDAFGKIYWKYGGVKYSSVGKSDYKGVNTNQLFATEPLESSLSITDNLKKSVGLIETPNTHYIQKLPPQIYLSGSYNITDKLQLGGLLHFTNELNGQGQSTLMFNAAYKICSKITVGTTAGFSNVQPPQFGIHLSLKFGIFQIIGVTDNIISVFQPYNAHYSNAHLGINIALK
jgi:Family of unknown function (DUF5723)